MMKILFFSLLSLSLLLSPLMLRSSTENLTETSTLNMNNMPRKSLQLPGKIPMMQPNLKPQESEEDTSSYDSASLLSDIGEDNEEPTPNEVKPPKQEKNLFKTEKVYLSRIQTLEKKEKIIRAIMITQSIIIVILIGFLYGKKEKSTPKATKK